MLAHVLIIFTIVMKRVLLYFIILSGVAGLLSSYTSINVPTSIFRTLYTVVGVVFSVGMSIAISSKADGVTNERMRRSIRSSYVRVRNSFMILFLFDTILYLFVELISGNTAFLRYSVMLCTLYFFVSIIHFIYNFIKLQELGEQIEDQVLKESQKR